MSSLTVLPIVESPARRPSPEIALRQLLDSVDLLRRALPAYPERIASRVGERIDIIPLSAVSHFYAKDKLTYAVTEARPHVVDSTIHELEQKLDPRRFVRVHRGVIVNVACVSEVHPWFGGRPMLRLNDSKRTEIAVSRERVEALKSALGI